MSKDPAFLFYSKDWLEGTAELMPAEKGVFVDLLSHQHQKGSLPTETIRLARLVGLPHDEFLRIWDVIKDKFVPSEGRTYNVKLNKVMSERSTNAHKNKIIGIFSAVLRKSSISQVWKDVIKKSFKVEDFIQTDSERLNERINEWYNECLHSLEDVNANEDVNKKEGSVYVADDSRETIPMQVGLKPLEEDAIEPLTDAWFAYIFDEIELERKATAYRDHDIGDQLRKFISKVRGSPDEYITRDTAGIRSAFDYHLRNTKPDKKYDRANGKGSASAAGTGVITGGKAFGNIRGN